MFKRDHFLSEASRNTDQILQLGQGQDSFRIDRARREKSEERGRECQKEIGGRLVLWGGQGLTDESSTVLPPGRCPVFYELQIALFFWHLIMRLSGEWWSIPNLPKLTLQHNPLRASLTNRTILRALSLTSSRISSHTHNFRIPAHLR